MISAIVVTYNRKLSLAECLESILSQKVNEAYEVIVVDNFSCDGTEDYIRKKFVGSTIKIHKNNKRMNLLDCKTLGINITSGSIIAFIDDDCQASLDWLSEIKKSLNNYDFVGGATLPMPDTVFPRWWNKSLNWLIGVNPKPNKKFLPLGSNIAFNKYVLDALQKNNSIILNNNQFLPYAEDNYRIKKALSLGFSMGINPNMIVYHRIPKQRLKIAYLLKRSYKEGGALATYENRRSDILFSLFALYYNFIRLFISLDINRIFRIISNASYILHYIKAKLMRNAENL